MVVTRWLLGLLVIATACSDSTDGEPIDGTITVTYGNETVIPEVGAAILDDRTAETPRMAVIIGTGGIDCSMDLQSSLAAGTYVAFSVDRTQAASYDPAAISVMRVEAGAGELNVSTGPLVIDEIGEDRIVGALAMNTIDDEVGAIAIEGTFDVIRCF